jgi:hypothetical protein
MVSVGDLSVVMAVAAVAMSDQTEDILAKFKVQQYAPLVVSVCTCERSESWVTVCMFRSCIHGRYTTNPWRQTMSHAHTPAFVALWKSQQLPLLAKWPTRDFAHCSDALIASPFVALCATLLCL